MKIVKYLSINLICLLSIAFTQDVNLQITNYSDNTIELHMQNNIDVAGVQFNVESTSNTFAIQSVDGGTMGDAGFTVSNSASTVLAFSFTGSTIPVGDGVLCYITTSGSLSDGDVISISNPIFSGTSGDGLSVNDIAVYEYSDSNNWPYYSVDIPETGSSTLFIFQDSISTLSGGDEVAVFDSNGYLDSSGNTGEILVGSGTWSGEQLEIVAIMGEDLSAFGGPILPGAVSGNPLFLKVWKNNQQEEFIVDYNISSGSGTFNELFSALSEIYFGDFRGF